MNTLRKGTVATISVFLVLLIGIIGGVQIVKYHEAIALYPGEVRYVQELAIASWMPVSIRRGAGAIMIHGPFEFRELSCDMLLQAIESSTPIKGRDGINLYLHDTSRASLTCAASAADGAVRHSLFFSVLVFDRTGLRYREFRHFPKSPLGDNWRIQLESAIRRTLASSEPAPLHAARQ